MTSLAEKKLLTDIFEAASSINEYLEGKNDYAIYMASKIKQRAVKESWELLAKP